MRLILLSNFIFVFIISLMAVAAEKPQVVAEKPGMTLTLKDDIHNPMKRLQDFQAVYTAGSNPAVEDVSLNEGFEDPTFPPAGWHTKNILGGVRWMRASGTAHSGTGSAIIAWETTGGEDWLVTPQLAIETGDSLKFWTRRYWPAIYPPDSLEIRISITDTSVTSFNTVLAAYDVNTFPNPNFGENKIDLNAFSGQNVYIAFRHHDVNGNGMFLDDVIVESTPLVPVMNTLFSALIAPPTPIGSVVSDTFGIVSNTGGSDLTISSITVTNSDFSVSPTSGTVSPGDTLFVQFSFTPSVAGTIEDLMTIFGDDPVNPSDTIQISGIGYPAGNVPVILAAQIGGDSQYRSFWVDGSWDSTGVYDPNWSGPMVELRDNGVAPDAAAGDNIFTGMAMLAVDNTNTYNWWTGSENDDNSFLDDGVGFSVTGTDTVYTDTLIVDGDNGINEWVISLAGSFNSWNNSVNDLTRIGDEWSVVIPLTAGTHEYKYAVMHQWSAAYGSGGIGGAGSNHSINVTTAGDFRFTFNDLDNSQSVVPYIAPIFMDDFEAYTAGQPLAQQNPAAWTTWSNLPGSAEDPLISTALSRSGVNSVNIIPNNDSVKPLGNYTSGIYQISFFLYVPNGNGAYFNTLQQFQLGAYIWGMQVYFDQNGQGHIDGNGPNAATFTYAYDTWLFNEVIVDLNADSAQFWLNGQFVHGWQWSLGVQSTPGPLQLAANNFYGGGTTATPNFYLDDYSITRLDIPTGITDPTLEMPSEFALDQNYPNPFNPTTTIKYALKENAKVTLKIYNLLGQEVRTLVDARQEAGFKSVVWDGLNEQGVRVASGVYLYQIRAGSFIQARKMIFMK